MHGFLLELSRRLARPRAGALDLVPQRLLFFAPRALAPALVDQLAMRRRRDPRRRIRRHTALLPRRQRRRERLLHRLFRPIARPRDPDQRRDNPPVLFAEYRSEEHTS